MAKKKLDQWHLATIDRVLAALAADPALTVARAMIACEDAYAALGFGLQCGLSVAQIATQAKEVTEEAKEAS